MSDRRHGCPPNISDLGFRADRAARDLAFRVDRGYIAQRYVPRPGRLTTSTPNRESESQENEMRTRIFHHKGHVIEVTETAPRDWRAAVDGDEVRGQWSNTWDAFLDIRRQVDRRDRRTAKEV